MIGRRVSTRPYRQTYPSHLLVASPSRGGQLKGPYMIQQPATFQDGARPPASSNWPVLRLRIWRDTSVRSMGLRPQALYGATISGLLDDQQTTMGMRRCRDTQSVRLLPSSRESRPLIG